MSAEPAETEKGAKIITFQENVEIEKLPYIFRGKIPDRPAGFKLSVHLPNWQAALDSIKKRKIQVNDTLMFEWNEGEIGFVQVGHPGYDKEIDLNIRKIRSSTWILPEESPYHDARGIGRFLMNNLLALVDVKGWTVQAVPMTDGRLQQLDMVNWLERKGFEPTEHAVRKSQRPDESQVIVGILKRLSV